MALSSESVGTESKWYKTGKFSEQMFAEVGVEVDFYMFEEET